MFSLLIILIMFYFTILAVAFKKSNLSLTFSINSYSYFSALGIIFSFNLIRSSHIRSFRV